LYSLTVSNTYPKSNKVLDIIINFMIFFECSYYLTITKAPPLIGHADEWTDDTISPSGHFEKNILHNLIETRIGSKKTKETLSPTQILMSLE